MTSNSRLETIQIDTREKQNEFIQEFITQRGYPSFKSKMFVGDYQFVCNPFFVIDRKASLSEVYGNMTKGHKAFKNEMERARANKIHVVILVEEENIRTLSDVKNWQNPQAKYSSKALSGYELFRRMDTFAFNHGCEFKFIDHDAYAETLVRLLEEARDKWLKAVSGGIDSG